jgi:hypothetical protein
MNEHVFSWYFFCPWYTILTGSIQWQKQRYKLGKINGAFLLHNVDKVTQLELRFRRFWGTLWLTPRVYIVSFMGPEVWETET